MTTQNAKIGLLVVLSLVEVILFSGLPFGWSSLVFVLKEEGVYSDLCHHRTNDTSILLVSPTDNPNETFYIVKSTPWNTQKYNVNTSSEILKSKDDRSPVSCTEQNDRLNLLFSIGVAVLTVFDFSAGLVNQRFGNAKTRLFFIVLYAIGALCTAFATTDIPWLILPGIILTGIGGFALVITNIRITTFLTHGSSIYIGFLNGCYDSSASVQIIVKYLYESGISRQYTYIGITVLQIVISGFITFLHSVTKEATKPVFTEIDTKENDKGKFPSAEKENLFKEEMTVMKTEKEENVKDVLLSTRFIFHLAWMSALVLRFYYFVGSINAHLENNLSTTSEVGYFTNILAYVMFGGLISSVIAGLFCEWQQRIFKDNKSEMKRKLLPLIVPLVLTSCLNLLLSGLAFSNVSSLLYLTFIVMVFLRSFMYCVNMQYFVSTFPAKYSTLIFGSELSIAGVFSMIQYALFVWGDSYPNAIDHVNILLFCMACISLLHPLNIFIQSRRHNSRDPEYS